MVRSASLTNAHTAENAATLILRRNKSTTLMSTKPSRACGKPGRRLLPSFPDCTRAFCPFAHGAAELKQRDRNKVNGLPPPIVGEEPYTLPPSYGESRSSGRPSSSRNELQTPSSGFSYSTCTSKVSGSMLSVRSSGNHSQASARTDGSFAAPKDLRDLSHWYPRHLSRTVTTSCHMPSEIVNETKAEATSTAQATTASSRQSIRGALPETPEYPCVSPPADDYSSGYMPQVVPGGIQGVWTYYPVYYQPSYCVDDSHIKGRNRSDKS